MNARNAEHAPRFRTLHAHGVLRLANAWDAGSARLIESLGAPAIATTSAGVAWAHGYVDGDALPIERLLDTVAEIARVIHVPLTVDMEGGYSEDPAVVATNVVRAAEAGAVGINIEDGGGSADALCAKLARIRDALATRGLDVYVNARTDVYLRGLASSEARVAMVLERAALYRDAGADGLFVPGVTEAGAIGDIASAAGLPLNVMLRPSLPPLAELEALGVRRLSAGSDLAEAMFAYMGQLAGAFLEDGRAVPGERMAYGEVNALFADR
jgi:2-methylisocitrate lyase-like PEP mutase family enzyme